jgi:hypothetical protein
MNSERRKHPRLCDPLPVVVRSIHGSEKTFQFNSITRDIGSDGLCAVAPMSLRLGEEIDLYIRFAVPGSNPPQAPSASARAVVLRTEEWPDGTCIFAASFLSRHTHEYSVSGAVRPGGFDRQKSVIQNGRQPPAWSRWRLGGGVP